MSWRRELKKRELELGDGGGRGIKGILREMGSSAEKRAREVADDPAACCAA